jgi:hypothetical protein
MWKKFYKTIKEFTMSQLEKLNLHKKKKEGGRKCRLRLHIIGGILILLLWIVLFVSGLLINSSYYRAALNYGYAEWWDWIMTILTFTLSNVPLLAFLAGTLGGICSLVIVTEGFTISVEQLKRQSLKRETAKEVVEATENSVVNGVEVVTKKVKEIETENENKRFVNPALYENPFLSGFRGVFVFVGILTLQYVSSFTDLTSIEKKAEEEIAKKSQPLFVIEGDSLFLADTALHSKYSKLPKLLKEAEPNPDTLVSQVFDYRYRISELKRKNKRGRGTTMPSNVYINKSSYAKIYGDENGPNGDLVTLDPDSKIAKYKEEIKRLRRKITPPSIAEIPGMTSFSYFKFAVIVSFMAFIFGYDPRRFTDFISKFNK